MWPHSIWLYRANKNQMSRRQLGGKKTDNWGQIETVSGQRREIWRCWSYSKHKGWHISILLCLYVIKSPQNIFKILKDHKLLNVELEINVILVFNTVYECHWKLKIHLVYSRRIHDLLWIWDQNFNYFTYIPATRYVACSIHTCLRGERCVPVEIFLKKVHSMYRYR